MVGLCNLTTSDCSDREIVPIRNPRVILSRPEAGKWWLELNDDEIFVRKRKGSLVSCQLAVGLPLSLKAARFPAPKKQDA